MRTGLGIGITSSVHKNLEDKNFKEVGNTQQAGYETEGQIGCHYPRPITYNGP